MPECDGQTDGQTYIPPLAIPAVCIACYANALVKTFLTFFYYFFPIVYYIYGLR